MENGTTAMTGHQDHPGTGKNFRQQVDKLPIKEVLKGLGVKSIREIDTYNQSKLTQFVKEAMEDEGLSVVIAKHPCMLKLTRENKRKGVKKPEAVFIGENCNKKYECISEFACPTFQINEDSSVWVQEDLCIGDRSCVQTCSTKAIVNKPKEDIK